MDLATLAARARALLQPPANGIRPLLPGLVAYRQDRPAAVTTCEMYRPVICLIVEGAKDTTVGADTFRLTPGVCMLISHDLPVLARILEAPYLALLLDVDVDLLRTLDHELPPSTLDTGRAIHAGPADPRLIDAFGRLVALAADPADHAVLGPLLAREVHYRLLTGPSGALLRRLIPANSHASGVSRAITHLRTAFREPVAVGDLARRAGMSVSAFHKHFKAITAATPVQFQKELRLVEARRILARPDATVATAAFDVGYQSPTQFSREYARRFGVPPSRDRGRSAP
jgi:AraC-like DNA-binding protein